MSRPVQTFKHVRGYRPGRSVFDLSYSKTGTCDMGELIPIACDEMVPGDKFIIGSQAVIRFQPIVAPILHRIDMYVHYFFVPYRLLWNAQTREDLSESGDWETFITGGSDGDSAPTLPTWDPTNYGEASLWDYLGFPIDVYPEGVLPVDFPRRAYNLVYNEFYRDETLHTRVAWTNEDILNRCWTKDYFTSALPWQQRGTSPGLPLSGYTTAEWPSGAFLNAAGGVALQASTTLGNDDLYVNSANGRTNMEDFFARNVVDLSSATPFDINDMRLAFQIQRWLERNARGGYRYIEWLQTNFATSPRDDTLQRPVYIGGSKSPIIVSEVLQTSETDTTPQGTLAGHGITVNDSFCGKYYAQEFGLLLGIMSVIPNRS